VREGHDLLTDRERTGAIVVTLPETLPVSEALELARGIQLHDIPLAQVMVNRVPFDPFSEEEREAVRAMLLGRAPTLGERTLERIDRARVALTRLHGEISVPIIALQDVWLDGPRLAEEMASLMAVEGAA
jgi:anion-transporting  ArsA/GET3 family ATPase